MDYGDRQAERRAAQEAKRQQDAYLRTLPVSERRKYLANQREAVSAWDSMQEENEPAPIQPFRGGAQMFGDHGQGMAYGAHNMAQAMAGQQGAHLAGMANQATNAIQEENERRVAQAREMRRMEHERQMKQMEIDAILSRLQRAQQPARPARVPIASGRNFAIYSD